MSTPPASQPPRTIPCPRCGATLGPEQDWCLSCGAPARTRLAPLPNWRLPVALVASLSVAAVIALILAFVSLTSDDPTVSGVGTTLPAATTQPLPTTAPVVPGVGITPTTAPVLPTTTAAVAPTTPTIATIAPATTTTSSPGGVTSP